MKKNLITVVILALVVVNLALTAVLTITIIPETQKANELITKVCSAIDLDLQAGDTAGALAVNISDMKDYPIDGTLTINLKKGPDGEDHYAVLAVSLSLDTTNEDYAEKYGGGTGDLSEFSSVIKNDINAIVSQYTLDEIRGNEEAVKEEILEDLQTVFKSNMIVRVNFASATYQ